MKKLEESKLVILLISVFRMFEFLLQVTPAIFMKKTFHQIDNSVLSSDLNFTS